MARHYSYLVKMNGRTKLPRLKRIILEHGLSLCDVLRNVYLDKGCKFIAVPGTKGYFNFAILDQSDLRNGGRLKLKPRRNMRICCNTSVMKGTSHGLLIRKATIISIHIREIRDLIWKCADRYTKGKLVFKVLHSLLVTTMSNGQTRSTASEIISHGFRFFALD